MIYTSEFMEPLFNYLEDCKKVPQRIDKHPEGNVFIHSIQAMSWAFRETEDTDLILAAMLHDVGKVHVRKEHPSVGAEMLEPFCSAKTIWLVEQHMRFWDYIDGDMKRLGKCQWLANHPWLSELVQLGRWDKMSRNPRKEIRYEKDKIIERLNKYAMNKFKGS